MTSISEAISATKNPAHSTKVNLAGAQEASEYLRTLSGRLRFELFTLEDLRELSASLATSAESNWHRALPTEKYVDSLLRFRIWHSAMYGFGVMRLLGEDGRFLGQAGLQVLDEDLDRVEVVIFLDGSCTGQGLGSEVLELVHNAASQCGMKVLYATIRPDNLGARRFFARAGAHEIGAGWHYGEACIVSALKL